MSYNYLELTETEEDYTGVKRANLITDELHEFTDANGRIFVPDLGQFYLNKAFQLVDAITGRVLIKGIDFETEYFSKRVFEKSSLDNAFLIYVNNQNVKSVLATYQCVGGLYTSPSYLIKAMMEKYPEGIGPVIYWKNVLFKPDQFVPAGHRHHALEVYALSPSIDALERVRGAMADKDRVKFSAFYDNTLSRFEELRNTVTNGFNSILNNLQQTRKGLELQQGDFIYTDNGADQATLRNYGKWRRHTNTILAAGGPNNAGTSMSVGRGYADPVRLTHLFQRIDDPWQEHGDITESTLVLQPSTMTFNEGDTVTIDIVGVNIQPGTQITGTYVGIPADNIKNGNLSWQATLDAFGKAQIKLETVYNARTTGNIEITILPAQYAVAAVTILMIDTSKTPVYRLFFSADAQGLNVITRVNEGAVMYMNIVVTNPIANEELAMNYSAGTANQSDFVTPLPATVTIPNNGIIRVRLEVKADEKAEGDEVFVAALLPKGSIDLGAALARAEVTINDTSYQAEFSAVFSNDTSGSQVVTEVNEGQTFYMVATTSLPNGTEVKLSYGGTMTIEDYDVRPESAIVSGGRVVAAITTKNDARTDGDKIMGLTVSRMSGEVLANLSLIVRDTSQAPEATIYFTDTINGVNTVESFNEGQTIFIQINTRNVENGSYIELRYQMDGAITQADINKEFTAPLPTRVPIMNNRATIAATILEDYTADGDRNFRCILDMSGIFASCVIRDTSVPIASAKFANNETGAGNITEANEGQTVYLVIETKGYPAGSILTLAYTGTATDADFVNPRPKTVTMNATGTVIVPMEIKNDYTSEGVEVMTVTVRNGAANIASTDLTIRDTSLTPVLSTILSASSTNQTPLTSINEGVSAYIHVNWTNLPLNSNIEWEVAHITTNAQDFDKDKGTMRNTVYTGTDYTTLTTRLDKTTEGDETFRISVKVVLPDGRIVRNESGIITLVDTSKTEEFTMQYSSDPNGNVVITQMNEGQAAYLVLVGSNIPNNTQFKLFLPSSGAGFVNDADLVTPLTDVVLTMNAGFVSHRFEVKNDRLTEGNETLIIRAIRQDVNISRDASIVVVDTSKTMVVKNELFLSDGSKPANNTFNEGQSGYLLCTFSDATIGDRMRPTIPGGAGNMNDADFSTSEFGTERAITATAGTLRWNFAIKNDRVSDGDKNFLVTMTNLTSTLTYGLDANYRVLDTSKTTSYNEVGWYSGPGAPTTTVNEGNTATCQVYPVNGVIGDIYRLTIAGGTATLNSDYTVNLNDITYTQQGMYIQWPFNIIADRLTEGNETILASIANLTTGQAIGTWQITIIDTSKTPTATYGWYDGPVAFGGNAITTVNEGSAAYFRISLLDKQVGDTWRVSIAPNSTATAADINNFQPVTMAVAPSTPNYLEVDVRVTADELTEGSETLIFKIEMIRAGGTTWEDKGTSSIVILDTSKTPSFDIYYSTNTGGTDRITTIGEGTTIYLIAKTVNIAAGTVLNVGFGGSTVDANDFTTAPPYQFPSDINQLVPMTVAANGIAYYRFDIKADLVPG